MIVIGWLGWVLIALAYVTVLVLMGAAVVLAELALRRARARSPWLRLAQCTLATLALAGALGPPIAFALHTPIGVTIHESHGRVESWSFRGRIEDRGRALAVGYGAALVVAFPVVLLAAYAMWLTSGPKSAGPIPPPAGGWRRASVA